VNALRFHLVSDFRPQDNYAKEKNKQKSVLFRTTNLNSKKLALQLQRYDELQWNNKNVQSKARSLVDGLFYHFFYLKKFGFHIKT
jgi:hypothetical protein